MFENLTLLNLFFCFLGNYCAKMRAVRDFMAEWAWIQEKIGPIQKLQKWIRSPLLNNVCFHAPRTQFMIPWLIEHEFITDNEMNHVQLVGFLTVPGTGEVGLMKQFAIFDLATFCL